MKRDPYFDVLKFFAMFLVVLGHVYWAMGCKVGMPYFENFRCGMNMPLFFMISGYFAARTIENRDWVKLGRHLVSYFWPLAVVSCAFALIVVVVSLEGCGKGLIGYAGRYFLFSAWYLWCLAICFTLVFLCCYPKRLIFKCGAFLFLFAALPFLNGMWHINNVRAMLPHFLFGLLVLRRWDCWRDWRVGLSCFLAFMVGVVYQGDILTNGLGFYNEETTWKQFVSYWYAYPMYLARIVNGILGSVGVMWLLSCLVAVVRPVSLLAPMGMTTLGVYILHQWILAHVFSANFITGVWGVLVYAVILFVICHFFVALTRRIAFARCFLWGDFA